jgi:hypothetical protein
VKRTDDSVCVARADGPGAGRFLAVALADALESGSQLACILASADPPGVGESAIDFVFSPGPGDLAEVIRAGMNRDGQVVCAELIRVSWAPATRRPDPGSSPTELLAALRAGTEIAQLDWDESNLTVTMRSDRAFRVALDGASR